MKSFYAAVAFAFIAVACGGQVDQDSNINSEVPSDNSFEPTEPTEPTEPEGTGGSASDASDDWNDNVLDETGGRQVTPSTGGHPATGGSLPLTPLTGGVVSSTGGSSASTGGMLVSTGGSLPEATGGYQPTGGTPSTGGALQPEAAGSAGEPSVSNEGGAGGISLDGAGCENVKVQINYGYDEELEFRIVTPSEDPLSLGHGMLNLLLEVPDTAPDLKVTGATVCQVDPNGDVADFRQVNFSWPPTNPYNVSVPSPYLFSSVPNGDCWQLTGVDEGLVVLRSGHSYLRWVNGILEEPVPMTSADEAWYGVARSGHTPALSLTSLTVEKVDGTCERTIQTELEGSPVLVRRSKPLITLENITEPLQNGLNTIARLRIDALHGRRVDVEGINFSFENSPELTIAEGDVNTFVVDGEEIPQRHAECAGLSYFPTIASGMAWLCFPNEDRFVTGDMIVEIRAMVSGVQPGSFIETRLHVNDMEERVRTFPGLHLNAPGALFGFMPDEGEQVWGFYWSDLAAGDAHQGLTFPSEEYVPMSADFTNEYLVPGADGSSTVTAP